MHLTKTKTNDVSPYENNPSNAEWIQNSAHGILIEKHETLFFRPVLSRTQ